MNKLPNIFSYFRHLYAALFLVLTFPAFCQFDSIMKLVDKEQDAAKKTDILLKSAEFYKYHSPALKLAEKAYASSVNLNRDEFIARGAFLLSDEYFFNTDHDSAIKYATVAAQKYKALHNLEKEFEALMLKTVALTNTNKVKEAFELNKRLIELAEELRKPELMAAVYSKMGALFKKAKDLEKSNSYFNKALNIYSQTQNIKGIESCYLNLGINNSDKSYNDLAIEYFERGLEINKKTNDNNKKALFLSGIAGVYYELLNFQRALDYYKDAQEISKQTNNTDLQINMTNNIGTVLMEMERFQEAKPYLIEVYYLSRHQKDRTELSLASSFNLSQLYQDLGDYKSAMEYMNLYVNLNDSLNNIENTKNLSEIEAKYQNEKKEEQNVLLNERLKNKSMQIYFALGGIALLSMLAFFIFRGLKEKQRANTALEEKNKIIEEKSVIVEQQHKDITDSIKYAERIQAAILPPEKLWKTILPQSFVFYQPKDILSGDFYWIEETADHVFIAAADCTGHGVPGALMSIVNYNLLNKAVLEKGLTNAGEILDGINSWLTQSLHQSFQESAVRDGMDLSLCVIDKKTAILNFAGAYNSIYLLRDNKLEELTSDKQPVGAFIEDNIKPFNNQYMSLTPGDVVYMFTDGYADQFGGEKGKKYKYKRLQALLTEIHRQPFEEQKRLVDKSINNWKGNLEQIDDILLLGYKWM